MLSVSSHEGVCNIEFKPPHTITPTLITEFASILEQCEQTVGAVILEGSDQVFCIGADLAALSALPADARQRAAEAAALYEVWLRMATASFVSIAHVRGNVTAGGVGFVAASDMVLADPTAQFALSELLFGLHPACVFPFLARRIGFQRAHYLALSTRPIGIEQASAWGLVDAYDVDSRALLNRHLLRIRKLRKDAVGRYKRHVNHIPQPLSDLKAMATAANAEAFSDPSNHARIRRYVTDGVMPWE